MFFAILSLPPLVFGLAGTIGYIARQFQVAQVDVLKNRVVDLASQALTPDTVEKVITPTMDDVLRGGRLDVISIGFVLALWSGSRALNVFIDTISIMYGFGGHRSIVKTRALSFTLYVVALLIGIVLVPLVLAGPDVVADVVPDRVAFLRSAYWPSVLVLSVGFMTTLYHLSVPVKKSWRSGLPGAVFTLSMWILGSYFVRWALGLSAGGLFIYGPLAAPIAVLLWLGVRAVDLRADRCGDQRCHRRGATPAKRRLALAGRRLTYCCGPSVGSPEDSVPGSFSSMKIECEGVEPMFSPRCVCAGSQRASPEVSETSRSWSPMTSFRSKSLSVTITLSGWLWDVVRSPGTSRYSSTRTRSFSNMTLVQVRVGHGGVVVHGPSVGLARLAVNPFHPHGQRIAPIVIAWSAEVAAVRTGDVGDAGGCGNGRRSPRGRCSPSRHSLL